jgi:sulfur-oxidizing protein SoxZ
MALPQARVSMPDTAKKGEPVEIKTLIRHPMETGYGVDRVGKPIPRHIVQRLTVNYNGAEIFRIDLTQGVAANPYIDFFVEAKESGDLVFTWEDDQGEVVTVTNTLTVT